ncbi:MAG: beta-phosphoglucomutase family hydrolase [Thermodesulfobacteriota bacterium]|nr:beta-phosphoglucomutase family hydrolase [Thermodesulfobacteriota bacterium]
MASTQFKGAIFDLDGVITGTARVHALAWESMFNVFLKKIAQRENGPFVPFDPENDYLQYVDGMPRMEGVKCFLESRGIEFPFGDYDDPPDRETICGMGNRKNLDFQKVLKKEGPDVFETSIKFVKALKKKGIKVGVASSSKNCKLILKLAGLEDLFETRVDGIVSQQLGLKGKPDPDIFVTAAENLGLLPGECMVVEDAVSGVQAGRNGNFGLTLGIARNDTGEALKLNGADLVVHDLGEISIKDITNWFQSGVMKDGWNLTYSDFKFKEEKLRETLTTVGNGYLGTRGCFEGEKASEIHYPGTYIAGIYNKPPTRIQGRNIYNNDFVNCPNWLLIEFAIGTGKYISPMKMEMLSYTHSLNMREGVTQRSMVCKDGLGRILKIKTQRLASMANPHLCAMQYEITPVNFSHTIRLRSSIDGNIINDGVARYRDLYANHLSGVSSGKSKGMIFLHVQTNRSKYQIVMSAKTNLYENKQKISADKSIQQQKSSIAENLTINAKENHTYTLEKLVSIYTSLDKNISNPAKSSKQILATVKSFKDIYAPHKKAWKRLWDKADIKISGDRFAQKAVRLHTYHLLVAASLHNKDIDAGITARGLHGEAYRGHVFWDELYILPFYNLHFPEISRALLMYRYHRLDAAKKYARENGYQGAMYPWQTADDGSEETQEVHYNPQNDSWGPDLSRRQRHVSIAVFYNVWRYVFETSDRIFLKDYGAEMMIEIARFWASIATYDSNKYHISGVMGPDEFHEKLPGSKEDGIKDNAYTNVMTVWLLQKAIDTVEGLSAKSFARLAKKTGFKKSEMERWKEITRKMNVILTDNNIISQFEGYLGLKELDWDAYRKKYGNIHRLDRILKAEGDSPDFYKVSKQADTLMMFYVLAPEEIVHILKRLGYRVNDAVELLKVNYDYYEKRTSHGSTLSKVVHAVISSYIHASDTPWEWFMEALKSDIFDTQGGTTIEGIHCGVMAGTLDVVMKYFAGIDTSSPILKVDPNLPEHWSHLTFRICHQKKWYHFALSRNRVKITAEGKGKNKVSVNITGNKLKLTPGKARRVKMN